MHPRPLLHIGYHKTATSWMQQRLFTNEHGYHQIARHQEVWDHIVSPHGLCFDAKGMREVIREGLADMPDGMVPVISSEILSGHPFFGGMGSDDYARRLKEIAPNARILITIRSQMKALTSIYMQYLLRGGTMGPEKFFDGDPDLGFHGFRSEHYDYHRLVGHYQALFGAENVYVVTQESLIADMDGATRGLARFAGNTGFDGVLPTHRKAYAPSYPEHAVPVLRRVNKLQRSVLNPAPLVCLGTTPKGLYRATGYILRRQPFATLLRGRAPITDCVRKRFSGRYDASNRALAELVGHYVDLSAYGVAGTPYATPVRHIVAAQ